MWSVVSWTHFPLLGIHLFLEDFDFWFEGFRSTIIAQGGHYLKDDRHIVEHQS